MWPIGYHWLKKKGRQEMLGNKKQSRNYLHVSLSVRVYILNNQYPTQLEAIEVLEENKLKIAQKISQGSKVNYGV